MLSEIEKYGQVVPESMNISCFKKILMYKSVKRKLGNITEKCLSLGIFKYVLLCEIYQRYLFLCNKLS